MSRTQIHNLRATPSRFKLHRQIILFASVRFTQYLVKRSTVDKRRDTLTARLQSAPIIRRCYIDGRRRGFEWRKAGVGRRSRKSRENVDVSYARYTAITSVDCEILRIYCLKKKKRTQSSLNDGGGAATLRIFVYM